MIILPIALILFLFYISLHPLEYLFLYLKLSRHGQHCAAKVADLESSNYKIYRDIHIPVIEFQTEAGKTITERPVYSLFMELNQYRCDQECVVFFDAENPKRFVVQSRMELVLTFAFVVVIILAILWVILFGIIVII